MRPDIQLFLVTTLQLDWGEIGFWISGIDGGYIQCSDLRNKSNDF